MPAMIVRREFGVDGVLPFEHPRRVRDANVEAAVRRVLPGRVDHRCAGMLLQDIPDHLDRVDLRLALHELDSFEEPTNRGAKRGAPGANLSLPLKLAQGAP